MIISRSQIASYQKQSPAIFVPPPPPPPTGVMNYVEKMAYLAGFGGFTRGMTGDDFDLTVGHGVGYPDGFYFPNSLPNQKRAELDTVHKASGQNTIKMFIPSETASGGGGALFTRFSEDNSKMYGANEFFSLQFMMRFHRNYYEYPFLSTGYSVPLGVKQIIIQSGDDTATCTPSLGAGCSNYNPLVMQNGYGRGIWQGYYYPAGVEVTFEEYVTLPGSNPGGLQIKLQNAIDRGAGAGTDYQRYCLYQSSAASTGCEFFSRGLANPTDEYTGWVTVTWDVQLGPSINVGTSSEEFQDSSAQCYISWAGEEPIKIFDLVLQWPCTDDGNGVKKVGKILFTPYISFKDPTEVHPEVELWYGNFIISDNPIPRQTADISTELATVAGELSAGEFGQLTTLGHDAAWNDTGGSTGYLAPYNNQAVWDSVDKIVYFIGGDHTGHSASSPNPGYRFLKYTESTNQWDRMPTPPWLIFNFDPPAFEYNDAHGYGHTIIDVIGRKLYRGIYSANLIRSFDLETQAWDSATINANGDVGCCKAYCFFPDMGANGAIIRLHAQLGFIERLFTGSSTWDTLSTTAFPVATTWQWALYNPVLQCVIMGQNDGNPLVRVDPDGTCTVLRSDLDKRMYNGEGFTGTACIDPVTGKLILLTVPGDTSGFHGVTSLREMWEYNILTNTYTDISARMPAIWAGADWTPVAQQIVSVPIDTYGGILFIEQYYAGSSLFTAKTWFYKHG